MNKIENGILYLTNNRLIIVPEKQVFAQSELKGFSIKNYKIYDEHFDTQLMGTNYFKGQIKTYITKFPKDLQFKIWFNANAFGRNFQEHQKQS